MAELTREDLARAVALPGWRRMPGMRAIQPDRVNRADFAPHLIRITRVLPDRLYGAYEPGILWRGELDSVTLDHTDHATAGCLLELLGSGWWHEVYLTGHHLKRMDRSMVVASQATLGAACIRAALALGRWPGGGE